MGEPVGTSRAGRSVGIHFSKVPSRGGGAGNADTWAHHHLCRPEFWVLGSGYTDGALDTMTALPGSISWET